MKNWLANSKNFTMMIGFVLVAFGVGFFAGGGVFDAAWVQAVGVFIALAIALYAAKTAYKSILQQITATKALDESSKKLEQETIYCAFAADLDALRNSFVGLRSVLIDDKETKEGFKICKSVFIETRYVVWENCVQKIGLLDKNHAANIVETYRFIEALTTRAKVLDFQNADHRNDLAEKMETTVLQIECVLSGLPDRPDRAKTGSNSLVSHHKFLLR